MANPYDPNVPLYEGQRTQVQQTPQANPQAASLHFLGGVGELVMAGLHFFSGGNNDEEEDEEAPSRVRPRLFGARPSGRVGKGSCCRRPVGR
jgi:hypothetical protein